VEDRVTLQVSLVWFVFFFWLMRIVDENPNENNSYQQTKKKKHQDNLLNKHSMQHIIIVH
jgi:hypothetical protein